MPLGNIRFKKLLAGLLAVAMVLINYPLAASAQSAGDGGKPKIAVWDFTLEGMQPGDGRAVTNRLRSQLVNSGKYRVMTRDQIKTLLGEQALGQTLIDAKQAIKAGKLKGVKYVVTGTIVSVRGAFQITAEMIDGESAEIIKSVTPGTYRGKFLDFLDNEIPRLTTQLTGNISAPQVAAVPPPQEQKQPEPQPEPEPATVGGKSGWMGTAGVISLAAAGVVQIIALSVASTAETGADEAKTTAEYNSALDDRESAASMQGLAVLLGIAGAIFLIVDSTQDKNTAAGYGSGAAPAGFNVDVQPGSVMAGYALRW